MQDPGVEASVDARLRMAMFAHLDALLAASPDGAVRSAAINSFQFDGRQLRLTDRFAGIWKPAFLRAALTIRTTYTAPDKIPRYLDTVGADGLVRYAYQGENPQAPDNRALREAMATRTPLAYFVGIERGVYTPIYPVWIVADEPAALRFVVAVDAAQSGLLSMADPALRRYARRLTMVRVHQRVFRNQVLRAYEDRCAMCQLGHAELLDAAHIIPDGDPQGDPVVPNGLSLCKIHHAAFDGDILGVRPDHVIEVQRDVLEEHDGPMLRHGLQGLAGTVLTSPRQRLAQPDPLRLQIRYERFLRAS